MLTVEVEANGHAGIHATLEKLCEEVTGLREFSQSEILSLQERKKHSPPSKKPLILKLSNQGKQKESDTLLDIQSRRTSLETSSGDCKHGGFPPSPQTWSSARQDQGSPTYPHKI